VNCIKPVGLLKGWDDINMLKIILNLFIKTYALAEMEVRKLLHDPTELISRAFQPIIWLGIFGEAMSKARAIPTGGYTYLQYITPGILTQSVVFVAIFFGLYVIIDRDTGTLQKLLVTPTPRISLVWSKMISAGVRGLSQAVIVILFALILQVNLHITPFSLFGVVIIIMLGAGFFTGLSMIIASIVKTRERFMGIGQVITLPLFFASNAIYPITIMPPWLQVVSKINPLSYMVEGLRSLIITGNYTRLPLDIAVLAVVALSITALSAYMYPKVVM
jgi:ABC-2 type transport system permease protein